MTTPKSYKKEYNGRWEKPLVNKPVTGADIKEKEVIKLPKGKQNK